MASSRLCSPHPRRTLALKLKVDQALGPNHCMREQGTVTMRRTGRRLAWIEVGSAGSLQKSAWTPWHGATLLRCVSRCGVLVTFVARRQLEFRVESCACRRARVEVMTCVCVHCARRWCFVGGGRLHEPHGREAVTSAVPRWPAVLAANAAAGGVPCPRGEGGA